MAEAASIVPQYIATIKCALCRESFVTPNNDGRTYWGNEEQSGTIYLKDKLLSVYQRRDQPNHFLMAVLDFSSKHTYNRDIFPIGFEDDDSSKINLDIGKQARSQRERTEAVTVHQTCWKLANAATDGRLSNEMIWNWKIATEFNIYDGIRTHLSPDPLYYSDVVLGYNLTTRSGRLLSSLSLLPKEIQLQISRYSANYMDQCHFSAAIRVINSSYGLLRSKSIPQHEKKADILFAPAMRSIIASWTNLYEHRYISELHAREEEPNNFSTNSLHLRPLSGIRFALGNFGIRGLKFLYEDKSESDWIGDLADCSIGTILGSNIVGLSVLRDSLKILRVDLIGNEINAPQHQNWMWKSEVFFSSTQRHFLRDNDIYTEWQRKNLVNVKNFDGWSLGTYLPFVEDGEYISALTIELLGNSISGIFAHGRRSLKMIGRKGLHSLHFPLQNSERIASIWMSSEGKNCSTVLFVTSLGRTCVGSAFKTRQTHAASFQSNNIDQWFLVSDDSLSPITGIFFDDFHPMQGTVQRFGTTKDTAAFTTKLSPLPLLPEVSDRSKEPYAEDRMYHKYLTIASFSNVGKIEICHLNNRYSDRETRHAGLLIHHTDGLIEAFGHWSAHASSKSIIYEAKDGPIDYIKFGIIAVRPSTRANIYETLDHIHIEIRKETSRPLPEQDSDDISFYLQDFSRPVEWWYSEQFDIIRYWEGCFKELPRSKNQAQEIHFTT